MADPRIETTTKIIQLQPSTETVTPKNMEDDVVLYWGNIDAEKKFLLPFWKGNQLMAQSPSKEIALKVTNIEDPTLADAEWVSFDANNPSGEDTSQGGLIGWLISLLKSLQGPPAPEPPTAYFVLGEAFFPLNSDTELKRFKPHHQMTLVARIGRTTAGLTSVFFIAAELLLKVGPGAGGPGASSGAKIPSGDGDE